MSINLHKFITVIFLLSLLLIPQNGIGQSDKAQNINEYIKEEIANDNGRILSPVAITYIDENFATASVVTPPSGWTQNIIAGVPGIDLWHFDNPGGRTIVEPLAEPVAIFDSPNYSDNGQPENVALESPVFNPPAAATVILEWYQYFNHSGGTSVGNVEVWNGTSWVVIYHNNVSTVFADFHSIDISSYVTGLTDSKIRFDWTGNGSGFWLIDNIKVYEPADVPAPAAVVGPLDGAVDVDINPSLEWTAGSGALPTGYRLYFGTDGGGITPPTNIENNTDLLFTTTYTPDTPLLYSATYYWMIVPYNVAGDATGNVIWSFTVVADPPITTFPYLEEFEDSFPPLYYSRFTGLLTDPVSLTSTNEGWEQDDWRNVISPINKAAKLSISGSAQNHWLLTTLIDLGTSTDYQIEFDLTLNAAGTSDPPEITGTDDRFAVLISTDAGATWLTSNILRLWDNESSPYVFNNINSSGEHISIDLSAYSGMIQIGFYGESTASNADNDLMIDNIEIQEVPALAPLFSIDPADLDFGPVAVGDFASLQATVSNLGTSDLVIENIVSSEGQFTFFPNSFPITISAGNDQIFDITFTPTSTGNRTATLEFTHNAAGSPDLYQIQGAGVDEGPTFSVSPAALNFGNVGINTINELSVTVSNIGLTNTLDITEASIAESGFTVTPVSASIPAGGDEVFIVNFNPPSAGIYSGNLIFTDNDPTSPHSVTLTGNASAENGLIFQQDTVYQLEDDSYAQTLQLVGLDPLEGKIQAIQFRLSVNKSFDDNVILTFQNIQKGSDVADANWVMDYNLFRGPLTGNGASVDSIYVLLYCLDQNAGLDPSFNYNDLLKVKYRIAKLPALNDTLKSSLSISNAEATTHEGYPIDITSSRNIFNVMALNRITSLGDVNGDGYLDILDLIMVVDHIVGRDSLTGDYFTRADISPWLTGMPEPEPDGVVNVQDLSLIQNIILTGFYPDNSKNYSVDNDGIKKNAGDIDAKVKLYVNKEGISIYVESKVDIRGAQIEFNNISHVPGNMSVNTDLGQGYYLKTDDFLRILLYDRLANKYIQTGEHFMADLPFPLSNPEEVSAGKIILVDMNRHKLEKIEVEIIYGFAPSLPLEYILFQNYPNPFNPSTTIKFQVPQTCDLSIKIYNILGQEVKTLFIGQVLRGTYSIQWDGLNDSGVKMSSGTYVYRMTAIPNGLLRPGEAGAGSQSGSYVKSNKMILLK